MTCRCRGGVLGGRFPHPQSSSTWHGVPCPLRASTTVSRSCVWVGVLQGGGGLFGSRRLSDNWKVPVLAWPSVPLRLAPVSLLLTTEGPCSSLQCEGTEPGREGQAESHLASHPGLLHFGGLARCRRSFLGPHHHQLGLFCGMVVERKSGCVQRFLFTIVCLLN